MDSEDGIGRRLWSWALCALLLALASYAALGLTGRWTVLGELCGQFRFFYGFGALAAAVLFSFARHWRKALVAIALAVWGIWPEGSLGFGSGPAPMTAESSPRRQLQMVSSNVLRPNTRHGEVFDVLLESDPDLIGLLELSPEWRAAALERLGVEYPFHAAASNTRDWNEHSWGLMLFSKTEITSTEVLRLDFDDWELRPVLQATLAEPFHLTITLAHPERPGKPARMRARRTALERIAGSLVEGHWLVIGDLNSTSTSPLFRQLIQQTRLRDSRASFGRQPTWVFGTHLPGPIPLPLPRWARPSVAIDHALHSGGLEVLDRRTLLVPGSDHRAVSVTLAPLPH